MKTCRSSIYCIPADEAPVWEPGTARFGWRQVTNPGLPIPPEVTGTDQAWHVIHCAPGTEPPINVTSIVVRGHVTPWTAEQVVGAWPNGHLYVMEATWKRPDLPPKRGKMIEVPEGAEVVETLLVPHVWAGDGLSDA